MAKRPIFLTYSTQPYYKEINVEFEFHNGFALSQKQKSINNLHEAFRIKYPQDKILEISTKSENPLGVALSAFNLMIITNDRKYSVEAAYQASKVFKNGGPYKDILNMAAKDAKNDPRLKDSGKLLYFCWWERRFDLTPETFFYNWLYINALSHSPELSQQLLEYSAFTDIAFNSKKSINCQARSAALYVSLSKNGKLASVLKGKDAFLEQVYSNTRYVQKSTEDFDYL